MIVLQFKNLNEHSLTLLAQRAKRKDGPASGSGEEELSLFSIFTISLLKRRSYTSETTV